MLRYKNNAATTLASPVGLSDSTITLAAGQGAKFPVLSSPDKFYLTLVDVATKANIEIVLVTATTGDILTVTRAQDGTTAKSFLVGDIASQRSVAAELADYASLTYGGTFASPVFGPTPSTSDISNQLATTAFVQDKVAASSSGVASFNTRTGAVTLSGGDVTTALGFTPLSMAPVSSVFGRTGAVLLKNTDVNAALGYTPVNSTALASYALLSGNPVFTSTSTARVAINNTSATTNSRLWDFNVDSSGTLRLRAMNDAETAGASLFTVTRTGAAVTGFTITSPATNHAGPFSVTGGVLAITNDIGSGYGGFVGLRNASTNLGPSFRVTPNNSLECVNSDNGTVSFRANDTDGNFGTRGLVYARGLGGGGLTSAGVGLGRIFVLPVGSGLPADLAESDIVLQY